MREHREVDTRFTELVFGMLVRRDVRIDNRPDHPNVVLHTRLAFTVLNLLGFRSLL